MPRILVVDDDPDFVEITRTILEKRGYGVIIATNGAEALVTMRRERPDLVLLDIMMTTLLDGLSVSEEMQADPELKDLPIIMVSAITATQHAEVFPTDEYVHMNAWISKPVDPEDLLKKVARCLRQSKTTDEEWPTV
ncbi:MAG: response regulator [Anaerolineae bacterium]|nr:MAG: response regulator [Anaerolineae bacterium]